MSRPKTSINQRPGLALPAELDAELHAEAKRQQRPISQLMQFAWRLSRDELRARPGIAELLKGGGK